MMNKEPMIPDLLEEESKQESRTEVREGRPKESSKTLHATVGVQIESCRVSGLLASTGCDVRLTCRGEYEGSAKQCDREPNP